MENYLGYEITLGKRILYTPLDLDKFYSLSKEKNTDFKLENREDAMPSAVKKYTKMSDSSTSRRLITKPLHTKKSSDLSPRHPPNRDGPTIHSRLKIVRDILKEMCITDMFCVKQYKTLDERQRSMMNKILINMFQPEFLDLIDTYQNKYIGTKVFLVKNVARKDSMIFHMRMDCFVTSCNKLNVKGSDGLPNSKFNYTKLAKECFIQSQSDANSDFPIDKTKNSSNLILREINTIRMSAVTSLEEGKPSEWLSKMHSLLQNLANIHFDRLADMYISSLDIRLNHLLYDKDKDLNSFFAKFKHSLKNGVIRPPLTIEQLRIMNMETVARLNRQIEILDLHLNKE